MAAYYNEIDTFAAAWLRELIKAGLIADGEVDERDIRDVQAADLDGFCQCHFFAGIGGWSYALRLAGWPDDRPVWTGSCPCQPFSAAGKNKGGSDDRHLWPHWARLIRQCQPVTIFGEQVESAIAHGWIDAVFDDLERESYACGAASLPAASVGAQHVRQRLWFVAHAESQHDWTGPSGTGRRIESANSGALGYAESCDGRLPIQQRRPAQEVFEPGRRSEVGELADTDGGQSSDGDVQRGGRLVQQPQDAATDFWMVLSDCSQQRSNKRRERARESHAGQASYWSSADWIYCRDGKYRPVEPGTFPLAHGLPERLGRLRGYGNAIVPQVAQAFIESYMSLER